MKRYLLVMGLVVVGLPAWGVPASAADIPLSDPERLITILATNDIHGGVEPSVAQSANGARSTVGGMGFWSGAVRAIRRGVEAAYGDRAGVVLVDGGDQAQGTLLSNYNEGQLVFSLMGMIGYDAAVPGNHDYDFGPIGWLNDTVVPGSGDQNPRGALERAAGMAKFPLLSANTYLRASLRSSSGSSVAAANIGCVANAGQGIYWPAAKRPRFVRPYVIKNVAGVRVALIGLDSVNTPSLTGVGNISDLCFRGEVETYREIRQNLVGHADVFVLIMHSGDAEAVQIVTQIQKAVGPGAVHAVIAAHTHRINHTNVGGVPIIQSGSGGDMFGRLDLVWNTVTKSVVPTKSRSYAGVPMLFDQCSPGSRDFCMQLGGGGTARVTYDRVAVIPVPEVQDLITRTRRVLAPMAGRKLGVSDAVVKRDRIFESPLADQLSDAFRLLTKADVVFLNTGGLRSNLQAGTVTYENLFQVLPFGNRAVMMASMPVSNVLALLTRSVQTCGGYGALMQSGLRVVFERNCSGSDGLIDRKARLVRVQIEGGPVILDVNAGISPPTGLKLNVATLDFLASGGSGYTDFTAVPVVNDLGIFRELLTTYYLRNPAHFSNRIDNRWKQQRASN